MNIPAIHAEKLCCTHPSATQPAFADVSFTLQQGQLLCLAGVNGSGKSTLLCALAGILPVTGRLLQIHGVDMLRATPKEQEYSRHSTALLLQDADMQIFGGTVAEDLLLSLPLPSQSARDTTGAPCHKNTGTGESREALAFAMAERFGLAGQWQRPPHQLSYGQKRKLCLASALLRNPTLLLLDEPFSGLDYPAITELRAQLHTFRKNGMALIVSTHDLQPLLPFTDSLLFLGAAGEHAFGTVQDVLPLAKSMGIRPPCESNTLTL